MIHERVVFGYRAVSDAVGDHFGPRPRCRMVIFHAMVFGYVQRPRRIHYRPQNKMIISHINFIDSKEFFGAARNQSVRNNGIFTIAIFHKLRMCAYATCMTPNAELLLV